ncbi:amidohydrolase [Tropicibacter sp. R16_0]|uniref:amidohydrolase n=1 Tax=Tropicibacter sp. R16_0 TaxID=2821102 RepID=UPI001AD95E78|nr:amidohydrolase [Tropicibacter sp. R16_0]MBO9453001.1 amidohydrolase [Tropicibacter sp. R16_0]
MPHADEIWTGGTILTMDPANPLAEAMAVTDGKITAVGRASDVENLTGPGTTIHQLHGRFVMPGLVESHTHALWGACRTLFDIYVGFDASLTDLLDAVRERCRNNDPSEVVFGGPWRPAMRSEMGANPRELLDAISTEQTIVLHDASQHLLWCNSLALQRAGIGPDALDIPGGIIERDPATGAPNGILAETATAAARALVARSPDQLGQAVREAVRYFTSFGFTAFKEPMAFEEELRTYQAADECGDLSMHMAAHIVHSSPLGGDLVPYDEMDRLRRTYASENVRLNFAKLFLDGVAPGFTASFIEPYLAESGYDVASHDPDATLLIPPAELNDMLIQLDRRGFTVKMHAVGDNAIRKGLDAIAAARAANGPSNMRHEIAHSSFVSDADLSRFNSLNAVAEVSPKMWYPNPGTAIQKALLGTDRVEKNHRIADLLTAGAEVIFGSDWPAAAPDANPWTGLSGMLTRRSADPNFPGALAPNQAISLANALPIFTTNGARSLGMERETGSIQAGKWADFIVLKEDLPNTQPMDVAAIRPQQTYWKGRAVFEACA